MMSPYSIVYGLTESLKLLTASFYVLILNPYPFIILSVRISVLGYNAGIKTTQLLHTLTNEYRRTMFSHNTNIKCIVELKCSVDIYIHVRIVIKEFLRVKTRENNKTFE